MKGGMKNGQLKLLRETVPPDRAYQLEEIQKEIGRI
jgi:hypothetical protein